MLFILGFGELHFSLLVIQLEWVLDLPIAQVHLISKILQICIYPRVSFNLYPPQARSTTATLPFWELTEEGAIIYIIEKQN